MQSHDASPCKSLALPFGNGTNGGQTPSLTDQMAFVCRLWLRWTVVETPEMRMDSRRFRGNEHLIDRRCGFTRIVSSAVVSYSETIHRRTSTRYPCDAVSTPCHAIANRQVSTLTIPKTATSAPQASSERHPSQSRSSAAAPRQVRRHRQS